MKTFAKAIGLATLIALIPGYLARAAPQTPNVGPTTPAEGDLLKIDNGTVQIGVDQGKGASITFLSFDRYPKNIINVADPGRLIQQSYYAGQKIDRTPEGQSESWSPWTWNPIQGGGVGAWARASVCQRENNSLYSETVPKLWDMPNEDASAFMRQWTAFEPSLTNTVVVKCEFSSHREKDDRWGPAVERHQELPACYFTRNFETVKTYLGDGLWREEKCGLGPPWCQTTPPRDAMAVFERNGLGVGIFSPAAGTKWNYGVHGGGLSDDETAGPCVHVAPVGSAKLAANSVLSYRYWLVVGDESEIAESLNILWNRYSNTTMKVIEP